MVRKSLKQRKRQLEKEVDESVVTYRGPILAPRDREETDLHTVVLGYTATLASDATGTIASFFVNNIGSSVDWSSFAAIYDEYRVLGIRLEYFPNNRYTKVTTTCVPALCAVDRDDIGTPASYNELMGYASSKVCSLEDPWSMEAHMSGIEDSGFVTTATTTPLYGIKMFATGLTVSTTYGRYFFYWRVQFRGRD